MQTLLAIDVSTTPNSVATVAAPAVLADRRWTPEFRNNRQLFEEIAACMRDAGMEFAQIDAYAVGLGPGSFTGIRSAVAAIRALAMPDAKPVVGVASSQAIAADAAVRSGGSTVVIAGDARRQRIWHAEYTIRESRVEQVGDFELTAAGEFPAIITPGTTVASPDASRIADVLASIKDADVIREDMAPRAAILAELGRQRLEQGDPPPPVPIYLHPPVFTEPRFKTSRA
jgi:tRNA threonylcarbamoyladenosine biosynthesis protein TsaB